MNPDAGQPTLQILSVARGPFVQALIRKVRTQGVRFDGDWADISRFVKYVNDGWGLDPGAGTGWFPPQIFPGVPRLHLPRTLTILAITSYLIEARGLKQSPLAEGTMSPTANWSGHLDLPGGPVLIEVPGEAPEVLLEALYVYGPPPVDAGVQKALADTMGILPFQPAVGVGILYAFSRSGGDIQGFSLPFLERDGLLLSCDLDELPEPEVAARYFSEPLNPNRVKGHLARYRELFDLPEALDRAWNRAAVQLLRRMFGAQRVL